MILYLIRHGQSAPAGASGDILTPKGRREVLKMARILKENGAKPQAVWHSPKKRAAETAHLVAEALGVPATHLVEKKCLGPDEGPDALLDKMDPDGWKQLMLVSHLPFLQGLTCRLLQTTEAPLSFPAAGVAALEKAEDHAWQVLWSLSPHNLADGK